jgi:hypothetical protein
MPIPREPVIRLTLNVSPSLYLQLTELASVTHLKVASCARMLIAEALATRELYKKHPLPPGYRPPKRSR